nr:hypothetical protein Iba_chr14eCG0040 [Ipomoea batatas]GME08410.1 hypothetical protein Iba_scaffold7572CG0010 [Ipomoea batatas]GME13344.1 hypothetical protein Iba_scaffold14389CG0070 [Ipomoea batatas]
MHASSSSITRGYCSRSKRAHLLRILLQIHFSHSEGISIFSSTFSRFIGLPEDDSSSPLLATWPMEHSKLHQVLHIDTYKLIHYHNKFHSSPSFTFDRS